MSIQKSFDIIGCPIFSLPWAQGVGRSNRPAPTNRISSLAGFERCCPVHLGADFDSCKARSFCCTSVPPSGFHLGYAKIDSSELACKRCRTSPPLPPVAAPCRPRGDRLFGSGDHWRPCRPIRSSSVQQQGGNTRAFGTFDGRSGVYKAKKC